MIVSDIYDSKEHKLQMAIKPIDGISGIQIRRGNGSTV